MGTPVAWGHSLAYNLLLTVGTPVADEGWSLATTASKDVERLLAALRDLPPPVAQPVLVVISGLPGSGKSYFSRLLAKEVPLAVLESDYLRQVLFPRPTYSADESARLFSAIHGLVRRLLHMGIPALLDATNLVEANREQLYHIADQLNVPLVLVYLKAPPQVVQERLQRRAQQPEPESYSTADWEVYQKMRRTVERIRRKHFVVDTSREIKPALDRVLREVRRHMRTA